MSNAPGAELKGTRQGRLACSCGAFGGLALMEARAHIHAEGPRGRFGRLRQGDHKVLGALLRQGSVAGIQALHFAERGGQAIRLSPRQKTREIAVRNPINLDQGLEPWVPVEEIQVFGIGLPGGGSRARALAAEGMGTAQQVLVAGQPGFQDSLDALGVPLQPHLVGLPLLVPDAQQDPDRGAEAQQGGYQRPEQRRAARAIRTPWGPNIHCYTRKTSCQDSPPALLRANPSWADLDEILMPSGWTLTPP